MLPPRRDTFEPPRVSSSPREVGTGKIRPAVPRKPLSLSSQAKSAAVSPGQPTPLQDSPGSGGIDMGSTDLLGDSASDQIEWKSLLQ